MYFALVVFKKAESAALLNESKFLQTRVNSLARKSIGYMANPFLATEKFLFDDEEASGDEQGNEHKVQKQKMEEDGFTLIT